MRRPLGLAAALALVLGLAACSDDADPAAEESDAPDPSALVVYSGRNENLVAPLLEQFSTDTGVEVSVRYGDTAALAAQVLEEGDRTEADVFLAQDAGALGSLQQAGVLTALPAETLDKVADEFRSDDGSWVGLSGRVRVMLYDPEQVPEDDLPPSVFELTDPQWSGKVAIAPTNASFQAFVTAMRVLNGDDVTREWLEGMVANDVQRFDNNVAILDAVDDGVVAAGLANHYYWFEREAEVGADAINARMHMFLAGDPGALVNVAGVGVLDGTDHAEDAQTLVDYLLDEKAQTYFAETTKEYPLVEGVEPVAGLVPLDEIESPEVDLSDLDDLQGTLTMLQEVGLT